MEVPITDGSRTGGDTLPKKADPSPTACRHRRRRVEPRRPLDQREREGEGGKERGGREVAYSCPCHLAAPPVLTRRRCRSSPCPCQPIVPPVLTRRRASTPTPARPGREERGKSGRPPCRRRSPTPLPCATAAPTRAALCRRAPSPTPAPRPAASEARVRGGEGVAKGRSGRRGGWRARYGWLGGWSGEVRPVGRVEWRG